jgi:hypothetical protein
MKTLSFVGDKLKIDFANGSTPKLLVIDRVEPNINGISLNVYSENNVESLPYTDCSLDGSTAFASLAAFQTWIESNESTSAPLASSENFLGAVGGRSKNIKIAIPNSATTYAAGKVIGGVFTIPTAARISGKETTLQSMHLKDSSNGKGSFTILIFESDPSAGGSGGAFADGDTFAYGSVAFDKQIGMITVDSSIWRTYGNKASAALAGLSRIYTPNGSANLFGVIVADAPVTLAANCLSLIEGFYQD